MAKRRTVTTTEQFEWDAEKQEWKPVRKDVSTVEDDDQTPWFPPYGFGLPPRPDRPVGLFQQQAWGVQDGKPFTVSQT